MKKIIKHLPVFVVLIALSLLSIFHLRSGIIAFGESSLYLNPSYLNFYSSWEEKFNFGALSTHQSNIVLFSLLWKVFSLFSYTHPSFTFIFLSFLLSGMFFYYLLLVTLKPKRPFLLLPAVLLYTFNTYRILGPINERVHLLLVFLPLLFVFYFQFTQTGYWRYLFLVIISSFLSSSLGANPPLFTIPYLLILAYFTFYVLFIQKPSRSFLFKNLVLFVLLIGVNLFWLYFTTIGLLNAYNNLQVRQNIFLAIESGRFFDHLRLLGSWAWRGNHFDVPYYSFALDYDVPPLLYTTYFITALASTGFFHLRKISTTTKNRTPYFFALLFPVSLLFLAGAKGPLGYIPKLLYHHFPLFTIYREPFAKFTPLFLISISFLLAISINYWSLKIKSFFQIIFAALVSGIVLYNAYPFFTKEAFVARNWIGGQTGYQVKVPEYWLDAKRYIESNQSSDHLFLSPYTLYGNTHNWRTGAGMVGTAAEYLIDKPILKAWNFENSPSTQLANQVFFSTDTGNPWLSSYLGFLNVRYLLQMNELDWRYSSNLISPPSTTNRYLQDSGLTKIAEFGLLTEEDLSISDLDPNETNRQILKEELNGQPSLILYEINEEDFLPRVYVPKQVIITSEDIRVIPHLLMLSNWHTNSAIVFDNDLANQQSSLNLFNSQPIHKPDNSVCDTLTCQTREITNPPTVEFKKLASFKYQIIIRNATTIFPLIFQEKYHHSWKLYSSSLDNLTKESSNVSDTHGSIENQNLRGKPYQLSWTKKPLNANHFVANGHVNGWLLDPVLICESINSLCQTNDDGSYDLFLSLEFSPQKIFFLLFGLSLIIVGISIIFIFLSFLKK